MNIEADFAHRAAAHTAERPWQPSPVAGVERRMLDRIGGEVARATSIVRYAPGSAFSPHTHGGGEEFVVLEGVFQDESGDFPAGSYVRNPPGTSHTPASEPGCVIFVKLWQFDPADRTPVRLDTNALEMVHAGPGVAGATLFDAPDERVRCERWEAGARVPLQAPAGAELLALDGSFAEAGETFARHDWLRLPPGSRTEAVAGPQGARVWLKLGHLARPRGIERS